MNEHKPSMSPEDAALAEPLTTSAQALFGNAYEDYHLALVQFLRRRVNNEADVADIAQETYLRLLRYHDRTDPGALKGLLFKIATNLILLRARTSRNRRLEDTVPVESLELQAADPSPERSLLAQQQLDRLLEALKSLPAKCQDVFVLSRFHNLTHAEIALRCGISVKMVEKYLSRALEICHEAVGKGRP